MKFLLSTSTSLRPEERPKQCIDMSIKLPSMDKPSFVKDLEPELLQADPPMVGPQVSSQTLCSKKKKYLVERSSCSHLMFGVFRSTSHLAA